MSKSFKNDLTGQRFGRLTVLRFVPSETPHSYWLCKCDCGNDTLVRGTHLLQSHVTSCGCLFMQQHYKHGGSYTRIYNIWEGMKSRCYNKNHKSYQRYGGRGIFVCDDWKNDFTAFRDWALLNGYSDDLSIDRIDNNNGYFPENCRWVDAKTQSRNRSSNALIEYKGRMISIAEAAEFEKVNPSKIYTRYNRGKRGDELFFYQKK